MAFVPVDGLKPTFTQRLAQQSAIHPNLRQATAIEIEQARLDLAARLEKARADNPDFQTWTLGAKRLYCTVDMCEDPEPYGLQFDDSEWYNMLSERDVDFCVEMMFRKGFIKWTRVLLTNGRWRWDILSIKPKDGGSGRGGSSQFPLKKTTSIGSGNGRGPPDPVRRSLLAEYDRLKAKRENEARVSGQPMQEMAATDPRGTKTEEINLPIAAVIWRYKYRYARIPIGYELSHLGEAFHSVLYIDGWQPGFKLENAVLEARELNESSKFCNLFGLSHTRIGTGGDVWKYAAPVDGTAATASLLDPRQSACMHAQLGLPPCVSPLWLEEPRVATMVSPQRVKVKSGARTASRTAVAAAAGPSAAGSKPNKRKKSEKEPGKRSPLKKLVSAVGRAVSSAARAVVSPDRVAALTTPPSNGPSSRPQALR